MLGSGGALSSPDWLPLRGGWASPLLRLAAKPKGRVFCEDTEFVLRSGDVLVHAADAD